MADANPAHLDPAVDVSRDHVLGPPDAEMTLVEYGSYACPHCHAVHAQRSGARMTPTFFIGGSIFLASLIAAGLGTLVLWRKPAVNGS